MAKCFFFLSRGHDSTWTIIVIFGNIILYLKIFEANQDYLYWVSGRYLGLKYLLILQAFDFQTTIFNGCIYR
jgi:hypothetical protein